MQKILTSVANIYAIDFSTGDEIFRGKTLIDSSIEMALSNTDVRGGRGNPLLYTYYHSADMNITINDAEWKLEYLGAAFGTTIATGTDVFAEETVVLGGGGAGTLVGTPKALPGLSTVYAWVKLVNGTIEKVTCTGSAFTASGGTSGQSVCVRYYKADAAARYINVNSNILPKIVTLVMDVQLNSKDDVTNQIGHVEIKVPRAQIQGNVNISMAADGTSPTPISARALADEDLTTAACSNVPILAKITEIIDGASWTENVVALAISGGDFALATTLGTKQLTVYAIRNNGDAPFIPPTADLTFASSSTGVATVSAGGLVTGVSAGTSTIKASITAAPTIDANVICTTPA